MNLQELYVRVVKNAKERAILKHEVSIMPEPVSEADKRTLALMQRMVQDKNPDSDKLEKIMAILNS